MQTNEESIWFPDIDFVNRVITEMVPALFPNYEDSAPDFQYLGGSQGRGLLESALFQPQQSFGGEYLYPSISDKAAALIWSITKNHPFNDGNKRAALTTCFSFLAFNRRILLARQSEAVKLCLSIAASDPTIDRDYVSDWINDRTIRVDEFDPTDANQNDKVVRYTETASAAEIYALRIFYKIALEADVLILR